MPILELDSFMLGLCPSMHVWALPTHRKAKLSKIGKADFVSVGFANTYKIGFANFGSLPLPSYVWPKLDHTCLA